MHVHFLDPYHPGASPVHRMDGRVKFILSMAFILTASLAPAGAWSAFILLLAVILAVEIVAELGIGYVLKRSALAAPFVLSALPLLFAIPGPPIAVLPGLGWQVSLEGLERAASLAFKSWISVQAAIVLSATTPFPDLLAAMRSLGAPRLLVSVFGLMWRYLFVLADEALRLMRARAARSGVSDTPGHKPGGSLAWRARVAGGMAGNLFVRGFERSDRIYIAMLARGYDGEIRSLPAPPISRAGWAVLAGGLLVLGLLLALAALI